MSEPWIGSATLRNRSQPSRYARSNCRDNFYHKTGSVLCALPRLERHTCAFELATGVASVRNGCVDRDAAPIDPGRDALVRMRTGRTSQRVPGIELARPFHPWFDADQTLTA